MVIPMWLVVDNRGVVVSRQETFEAAQAVAEASPAYEVVFAPN